MGVSATRGSTPHVSLIPSENPTGTMLVRCIFVCYLLAFTFGLGTEEGDRSDVSANYYEDQLPLLLKSMAVKRARKSLVESLRNLFAKRAPAPLMRFSMMQYLRDLENQPRSQKYGGAVDFPDYAGYGPAARNGGVTQRILWSRCK